MASRPGTSVTEDHSLAALQRTIADVRRSAALKRKLSLPNARRLYLRRAAAHRRAAHLARLAALYR